jgi:hypothetical protein
MIQIESLTKRNSQLISDPSPKRNPWKDVGGRMKAHEEVPNCSAVSRKLPRETVALTQGPT